MGIEFSYLWFRLSWLLLFLIDFLTVLKRIFVSASIKQVEQLPENQLSGRFNIKAPSNFIKNYKIGKIKKDTFLCFVLSLFIIKNLYFLLIKWLSTNYENICNYLIIPTFGKQKLFKSVFKHYKN